MRKTTVAAFAPLALVLMSTVRAGAQEPLPTLPPAQTAQPTQEPPPAAPGYGASYGAPPPPDYRVQSTPPAPPPFAYTEAPVPVHAPKFSLWAGGRLGLLGFGGNFYQNSQQEGETTGNFITNGLSLGLDAGARLGKRYVPYVFLEHGFVGAGHRFDGSDATASTDLYGVGFRYVAGDVDSVGFLTDLSVGVRSITVKNNGDTYKMSAIEIFRLGLGAEIRLTTLFSISPMATISSGTMSDTEGHVAFSAGDVTTRAPTYQNGKQIDNQRSYIVFGVGCGGHFDILESDPLPS